MANYKFHFIISRNAFSVALVEGDFNVALYNYSGYDDAYHYKTLTSNAPYRTDLEKFTICYNKVNRNFIFAHVVTQTSNDTNSKDTLYYLNSKGELSVLIHDIKSSETDFTRTCSDEFFSGVSSLSVTADSGINHILYNSLTYDTFPATIPLDPAATTMQLESKSPVLTINDGGNLKSVTYGSATYTKFPATVTATAPEFAVTARGKDSPVITVRTERTQSPVITNT